MPKQIIRFKCDFCKKSYAKEKEAQKHEEKCFYNEATKSCATCINMILHDKTICGLTGLEIFVKGSGISNCQQWESEFNAIYG